VRRPAAGGVITSGAAALALIGGVGRAESIGLVVFYLVVVAIIWRPDDLSCSRAVAAGSGQNSLPGSRA